MNVLLILRIISVDDVHAAEMTDAEDCVYTAKCGLESRCCEEVGTAIPTCIESVIENPMSFGCKIHTYILNALEMIRDLWYCCRNDLIGKSTTFFRSSNRVRGSCPSGQWTTNRENAYSLIKSYQENS